MSVNNFKVGQRVIVVKVTQADIKEGIRGDMLGHINKVTDSFIHVSFYKGKRHINYPFFHNQIKPFTE